MKNDNRTAAALPTSATRPARPARAEARSLPASLASLATRTPDRRVARGKITPNAFTRAEMRDIVLEMIG